MTAQPQLFTMNKLVAEKVVGRGDLFKVRIDSLVIVEGFNESRKFNDPAELRAHIDGMKAFVRSGGILPAIEVFVNPETGATEVVEGHCRTAAFRELLAEDFSVDGKPFTQVAAIPFKGTMAQRRARIVTSNSQLALSKVGEAMVYQAMRDIDGMHAAEIAVMVGKSRGHIDQMLILASGGEEVHQAITDGVITPTEAVHVVRKHGDGAAQEIERLKAVAAETGKGKITGAVRKKAAVVKREWPSNLVAASKAIHKVFSQEEINEIILGEPHAVSVPSDLFVELLMAISEIPEDEDPVDVEDGQLDMLEGGV
jgi:ParB-like chromosome segregation protein Spo0J